jgi:phage terminase large subunit-like protein
VLEAWQTFIIANIFGWRLKSTGKRRFRKAHIEIGRKNGKTALAALIALICFVMDGEGRPEVYTVATKRAQSKLCWQEADRFRSGNDWLKDHIRSTPSKYIMTGPDDSVFVALGGDGGGDDGLNPSLVIFDELHEWKNEGHLKLWDKMRTGSSTRPQPLFVTITTAGDTKSYLWKSERKYAEAVARGEQIDDTLFSFVCCLDRDDDIFDPDNWPKANPGLGTIKKIKDIEDLANEARINPTAERQLKRYHCNLMVEPTAQGITKESWAKGNQPLPDLTGRICYGGLDLGWLDDLAAFWLVFPPTNPTTGIFYTLGWAFCPLNGTRDFSQGDWQQWLNQGLLIATPGTETNADEIHKVIEQARKKYKLKGIALDTNNARQFGQELEKKGHEVCGHGQKGIHYNEPLR